MRRKIGIDCRMIKATGIGRYVSNLVNNLTKLDLENEYILFFRKDDLESFDVGNPNFKKVIADYPCNRAEEQMKLPFALRAEGLDLVHFPHFNVPLIYRGKYVVSIQDITLHHYPVKTPSERLLNYKFREFFFKMVIKNAMKNSLKILVSTYFTKNDLVSTYGVPEEKIVVNYYSGSSEEMLDKIPDNRIIEKFGLKKPFILYVGNAYPSKNLERLLYALKYLPESLPLVFAGQMNDFYKEIKALAVSSGLEERAVFTDYISDEQLVSLYKNASVFVFPSLYEGFGIPPLEALSFGLPVVSSDRSTLPEILDDAALFFNPEEPREIALKITEVLSNDALRHDLIERGYQRVKMFSWERMARKTLEIYQECLD